MLQTLVSRMLIYRRIWYNLDENYLKSIWEEKQLSPYSSEFLAENLIIKDIIKRKQTEVY